MQKVSSFAGHTVLTCSIQSTDNTIFSYIIAKACRIIDVCLDEDLGRGDCSESVYVVKEESMS